MAWYSDGAISRPAFSSLLSSEMAASILPDSNSDSMADKTGFAGLSFSEAEDCNIGLKLEMDGLLLSRMESKCCDDDDDDGCRRRRRRSISFRWLF
eukprot:CCRYP_002475-RA/>CCRYP_002475-RA protein AED:0.36 eAED:0.36 QI:88/1/1/1/0/0/2/165/95